MINFSLQIHITENCPYKCKHCYINENAINMTDEIKSKIGAQILKLRYNNVEVKNISVTGGDPLCHPDWETITKYFIDLGINVGLLGTPRTLTNTNIEIIKRIGIARFQVSIDGMEDIHDSIRGEGAFRETIAKIRELCEHGIVPRIMFTMSEYNKHELFPLIDYLDSLDLPVALGFDFCIPIGNAENNKFMFKEENIYDVIIKYAEKNVELRKKHSKVVLCNKSHYLNALKCPDNEYMNEMNQRYSVICGCSAGWSSMSILSNGDIYPCRRLPIKLGNIISDDLYDLLINHPMMKDLRNRNNYSLCKDCSKYSICRGCPAMSYALHKAFSPLKCSLYSKHNNIDNCSFASETAKIFNRGFNHDWNLNKMLNNKNFIKCFYLLRNQNHMSLFISNPTQWLFENNISLKPSEIDYLFSLYLR